MEIVDTYGNPIYTERPAVKYAGFWARFAASFIDGLIIGIPMAIINYLVFGKSHIRFVSTGLVGWLYCALQESGPGMATIGKKVLDIKVTDLNGGRLTFGQATGRHFGKVISTVILLIGYFMMLWDDKSQTLHDKMAGALVISTSA